MVCLSSSRSAVESHVEVLSLQTCSLGSCRKPLCIPSHNCHQAWCPPSQGPSPLGLAWTPFLPQPQARCSPQAPFSVLSVGPGCLRAWEPHNSSLLQAWWPRTSSSFPTLQTVVLSHPRAVSWHFPRAQHPPWQWHGINTVNLPDFYLPERPCPVAEQMHDTQPYQL